MKSKQLCLFLFLSFASFCVQHTSKGAAMATNSTDGPQGQREVRTTAYAGSRHGTAKNANGSHLKAGDLNSAAADWSRFPLGTKFNIGGTHQTYVVDDYGPALVGTNNIDLYMPSRPLAAVEMDIETWIAESNATWTQQFVDDGQCGF